MTLSRVDVCGMASGRADGEGGDDESGCQHDGGEREAEGVAELSGFCEHVRYGGAAVFGYEDEEGQRQQDGVTYLRRADRSNCT